VDCCSPPFSACAVEQADFYVMAQRWVGVREDVLSINPCVSALVTLSCLEVNIFFGCIGQFVVAVPEMNV